MKDTFLSLLSDVRPDIIKITHALPYSNPMMGVLGHKDMKPYDHMLDAVRSHGIEAVQGDVKRFYNRY